MKKRFLIRGQELNVIRQVRIKLKTGKERIKRANKNQL